MGITLPNIACVMFGDGASDEGIFYECLNFASLKRLPVVFICENNRYSVYTHSNQRRCVRPYKIAEACGIKSVYAPIEVANDTVALYKLLEEHIDGVRSGKGPLFVECDTVRAFDHNGVRDDIAAGIRPQSEAELFERYCPLKLMRNYIDKDTADTIDQKVREQVDEAFNAATQSEPLTIGINYEQLGHNACFT
jgi:pyruvate dehydrogenase E1 component alpha subunit